MKQQLIEIVRKLNLHHYLDEMEGVEEFALGGETANGEIATIFVEFDHNEEGKIHICMTLEDDETFCEPTVVSMWNEGDETDLIQYFHALLSDFDARTIVG